MFIVGEIVKPSGVGRAANVGEHLRHGDQCWRPFGHRSVAQLRRRRRTRFRGSRLDAHVHDESSTSRPRRRRFRERDAGHVLRRHAEVLVTTNTSHCPRWMADDDTGSVTEIRIGASLPVSSPTRLASSVARFLCRSATLPCRQFDPPHKRSWYDLKSVGSSARKKHRFRPSWAWQSPPKVTSRSDAGLTFLLNGGR